MRSADLEVGAVCALFYNFLLIFLRLNLCFWNCQGVGHLRFHNFVHEYCREFAIDILCLFETRISGVREDGILVKLRFLNSFR